MLHEGMSKHQTMCFNPLLLAIKHILFAPSTCNRHLKGKSCEITVDPAKQYQHLKIKCLGWNISSGGLCSAYTKHFKYISHNVMKRASGRVCNAIIYIIQDPLRAGIQITKFIFLKKISFDTTFKITCAKKKINMLPHLTLAKRQCLTQKTRPKNIFLEPISQVKMSLECIQIWETKKTCCEL